MPFNIDKVSGEIRTREALNFEEKSTYILDLTAATATGQVGRGKITVKVRDQNEKPPEPVGDLRVKFCSNNQDWSSRLFCYLKSNFFKTFFIGSTSLIQILKPVHR